MDVKVVANTTHSFPIVPDLPAHDLGSPEPGHRLVATSDAAAVRGERHSTGGECGPHIQLGLVDVTQTNGPDLIERFAQLLGVTFRQDREDPSPR